jgi:Rrf2 family protein
MFSRFTGYALKAMAYLACQPTGELTGAREIAAATGIPIPFLWKVLRHLNGAGLLNSAKGVRGGYELARPAKRISLMSVVKATQRENPAERCPLGLADCGEEKPCSLHKAWHRIRDSIRTMLLQTTVADLARHASTPRTMGQRPAARRALGHNALEGRRRPNRLHKRS